MKRLVAAPAALAPPAPGDGPGWRAVTTTAGRPDAAEPAGSTVPPDAGPLLDEAFGPEPR